MNFYKKRGGIQCSKYTRKSCTFRFASDSELRLYISTLSKSAYVRMSAYDAANDSNRDGSHSFVYVSHTTVGVTMYETNRDDK